MPILGIVVCKKIMKELPEEFSLGKLRSTVAIVAGMEPRTVEKYCKKLSEIKYIENTTLEHFKKTKKGIEESEQQTKRN